MKRQTLLLLLVMFFSFNIASAAENDAEFRVLMCVQCDDLSWRKNAGDVDYFASLKAEIENRGGRTEYLEAGQRAKMNRLKGIDLVVFIGRTSNINASEKAALTNFVKNGGGMLVLADSKKQRNIVNPFFEGFGIRIGNMVKNGNPHSRKFTLPLYEFNTPASIVWRIIEEVHVVGAWQVDCFNQAQPLVWRYMVKDYAKFGNAAGQVFMANGSNTGEGRLIVVGDIDIWRDASGADHHNPDVEVWSRGNNKELFENVLEYLVRINDLSLFPVLTCKDTLVAGENHSVKIRIDNLYPWPSRNTTTDLYLCRAKVFSEKKSALLATVEVPSISECCTWNWSGSIEIPANMDPRKYYLHAIVNMDGGFQECNSANNGGYAKVNVK